MRAHILGTGLLLGLASAAFTGPVASATDDTDGRPFLTTPTQTPIAIEPDDTTVDLPADFVSVIPAAAAPGQTVQLQARCDGPGDAVLHSPVLRAVTLAPDPEGHQPWAIHGTTTVTKNAKPGDYPVSMQCGEGTVKTTITVLANARHDGGQRNGGQVSRVPRGAPETGEGPRDATVPLLAVGLVLGMTASAFAWREVRK